MTFRRAQLADVGQIMEIRFSVTENVLFNPGLVTAADCADYLTRRGNGWVREAADGQQLDFAIADLVDHNSWALFVRPGYEDRGIGRGLQQLMLAWYFEQTSEPVWLGTGPGTRAETFYRCIGWRETGRCANGEVKFEMMVADWQTTAR